MLEKRFSDFFQTEIGRGELYIPCRLERISVTSPSFLQMVNPACPLHFITEKPELSLAVSVYISLDGSEMGTFPDSLDGQAVALFTVLKISIYTRHIDNKSIFSL